MYICTRQHRSDVGAHDKLCNPPLQSPSYLPCKLFVGCLPLHPQATQTELEEHFSQYGELADVYIPSPYRGFGFVTYKEGNVAKSVVSMIHTLRRSTLNVSLAEPKGARQGGYPYDQYQQQWFNQQVFGASQFAPYAHPLATFTAAINRAARFTPSQQSGGTFSAQQNPALSSQAATPQQNYQQQGYQDNADRGRYAPPPPPPAASTWERDNTQQFSGHGSEGVGYSRSVREPQQQYPQDSKTWNY